MDEKQPSILKTILQISHPLALLAGILLYALGAGVADFLGHPVSADQYFLGQACITLLQLTGFFMKAYFDMTDELPRNLKNEQFRKIQQAILLVTFTILTVGAVITVILITQGASSPAFFAILGAAFLLSYFYAIPPLRLAYQGYGELMQAVLLANLTPAFAYIIQVGEMHRLLALLTFPLTTLLLAALLVFSLPGYAEDLLHDRKTLMIRLGWPRGMTLHNGLILVGYLLLAVAYFVGLPWPLTWPGLLSVPIAIFQIWQLGQIANGVKPRWSLLLITAAATFGLTAYMITYSLWIG